jgi:hypothetical protein
MMKGTMTLGLKLGTTIIIGNSQQHARAVHGFMTIVYKEHRKLYRKKRRLHNPHQNDML